MTRLECVKSRITANDIVLDVGCDSAILGEMLARDGISSYASDVREHIVLRAKERINNIGLGNYVKFFLSDGLDKVDVDVDTLVFAGMGSYTILEILSRSLKKFKKIITVSNNNYDTLRKGMLELGYVINEEEIILEKGKYYNLILFCQGSDIYTETEILLGKNHVNIELLKSRNEYLINKYSKYRGKNEKIDKLIRVIESYKY